MKQLIILLTALLVAVPSAADKPLAPTAIPGSTVIGAEQLVELIESRADLVIIDARRHEEYAKGHIGHAISLLDTTMTAERLKEEVPDKRTPLVFYCNGVRCLRSSNAVQKALGWDYQKVYWFRGGWQEWLDKELPISH